MLMNEHKEHNSFVAVQLLSHVWLCNPTDCGTPGFPVSHHLSELAQTYICWVGNVMHHLIFWCPLPLLLSIFSTWGYFLMNQLFASGGQSIGALASILPMNTQGWFPLGLTGLISLKSRGLSRVFNTTVQKHQLNCGVCVLIVFFDFTDFSRFLTPIGELGEWLIP